MKDNWLDSSSEGAEESYGKVISAIYRHLQILIADGLAPYRIGSGQYIFLMAIAAKESTTQKALSEDLLIDKTTTAKAIAKLEAEGYARRESDPADNRYHLLYLTEAGKTVVPKVQEALDHIRGLTRDGISDEEYAIMLTLLKKLLGNVNKLVRSGDPAIMRKHDLKEAANHGTEPKVSID